MVIIERSRIDELDICTVPEIADGHGPDSCSAEPGIQMLAAPREPETVRRENLRSEVLGRAQLLGAYGLPSAEVQFRNLRPIRHLVTPHFPAAEDPASPADLVAPSRTRTRKLRRRRVGCVTEPHAPTHTNRR